MSDNFKWTDELVKEYISKNLGVSAEHPYQLKQFEGFKKLKKPKEWEILSIVLGGVVKEYTGSDYQDKSLKFGYEIHSIKRLSDGEVFSIGDSLDEMEIGDNVITGFFPNYKGNTLWVSTNNARGYGCSLGVAKKKQNFLFTTHDRVDVYRFDTFPVYKVTHPDFYLLQFSACDANPITKGDKYFVDKTLAGDYILQNKPITITYTELYSAIVNRPLANIKDFFKSKIYP